jgi:hypothetical protein
VCRIFLSSLTPCNTSSFLTRSVQTILSILLQHHISKLSRHFWLLSEVSTFQHNTKLCFKCSTLLVYSLNLSPVRLTCFSFFPNSSQYSVQTCVLSVFSWTLRFSPGLLDQCFPIRVPHNIFSCAERNLGTNK